MKGLLLKNVYLSLRYCRLFLLLLLAFGILSFFPWGSGAFFLLYVVLTASTLPWQLCVYDERDHWASYMRALPLSRAQYVSAQYLFGLLFTLAVLLLLGTAHALRAWITGGGAALLEQLRALSLPLAMGLLTPAFLLPFVFRLGAERTKYIYTLLLWLLAIASFSLLRHPPTLPALPYLISFLPVPLYAASWLLSTRIYKPKN